MSIVLENYNGSWQPIYNQLFPSLYFCCCIRSATLALLQFYCCYFWWWDLRGRQATETRKCIKALRCGFDSILPIEYDFLIRILYSCVYIYILQIIHAIYACRLHILRYADTCNMYVYGYIDVCMIGMYRHTLLCSLVYRPWLIAFERSHWTKQHQGGLESGPILKSNDTQVA